MSDYAGPEVWHEAGHALAALHLGGEVRLVTIESDLDEHVWEQLARMEDALDAYETLDATLLDATFMDDVIG